ncbi:sulfate permease [Gryllotalpicola protaetiae]|uniref:Sulfate permease n=1 Tax=Gryllotalpicola protaetiae TaxID=2419771 RepID=A0A387BS98_9MICO|nr:sulfate permease [Gryllotalpicola protaetiae]AYG05462.1 sulfate permease [Gryllotalpicola protaetiae]
MLRLLWAASVHTRYFLRRYMPTNILLDLIRTRRGLKWGVPAMLLAAPHLLAASICTNLIADGAPGWLNLLVLLFLWNALKFLVMGPVSLVLLLRVCVRESAERRRVRQQSDAMKSARYEAIGA